MKCISCGFDNAQTEKTCASCGTPLSEQPKEKKGLNIKFNKKTIAIAIGALAALILVIVLISAIAAASSSYVKTGDRINLIYSATEDELSVFVNGTMLDETIDGALSHSTRSLDGSVVAVITDEGDLYLIKGRKITEITDDITTVRISADGKNLVYLEDSGDLFTYKISSGKSKEVDEDVQMISALSPDGKSFGYVKDSEGYLFTGGKGKKLEDDDQCIVALTNGAKWMYLTDIKDTTKLYVMKKGGESEKLASDATGSLYFTKDMSELIFRASGKTYFYKPGKDKVKLDNDSVSVITPKDCAGMGVTARYYSYLYGIDTFAGLPCLVNGEELTSITKKMEIADDHLDVDTYTVVGDHIFYLDGDELYRVKIGKWKKEVELANEVESFKVCDDGKTIYYQNDDGELMYLCGKKEEKIVSDIYSYITYGSNSCLFISSFDNSTESGKLYLTKNGNEKEKLASDAYRLTKMTDDVIYYRLYNEKSGYYDLYFSKNAKDFELLVEGVR